MEELIICFCDHKIYCSGILDCKECNGCKVCTDTVQNSSTVAVRDRHWRYYTRTWGSDTSALLYWLVAGGWPEIKTLDAPIVCLPVASFVSIYIPIVGCWKAAQFHLYTEAMANDLCAASSYTTPGYHLTSCIHTQHIKQSQLMLLRGWLITSPWGEWCL